MIKKVAAIILILCAGFGAFIIYAINHPLDESSFSAKGDLNQIKRLKEEVYNYLVSVKGYKSSEILSVEGLYTELKKQGYSVNVKFKDEPNATYEYQKKDGKIIMISISGVSVGEGKHADGMWKNE